ncbi:hypothetical protein L198_02171 [Cryptococcus wingfieldii CBS 7118]|uniref:Uncharacterized protein n=1 Tax=Cryptococcus wingfieldii CBS 7118 TaxID=1295528 RepID=A0A1E3JRM8_9TREE|nr:hypothetical protein L198_02171 [Cryptococcus wingfieldii CBS 7118]ODO03326.1 hypothetical protein L198_02171 [Cryptococcus wingfieldii CBS 7118]
MYTKLALLASVTGVATALTINSPASLIECQPTSLSWSDGTSPYYLAIIHGGEVSSSAYESFDAVDSSPYTWTVNLASGTNVTIRVTDSDGTIAYSSPVVIQSGSSSSCLTSSISGVSTSSSGTSDGSSSTAAASTTGSGSSSTAASSGSTSAGSSDSSTSASASSSTYSSSSSSAFLTKTTSFAASFAGLAAVTFAALA